MRLSLSLALFPMKRRSKARTRSVAKSLRGSGSGSRDRKNPAQLLKLRDEKKEVKGVQDSLCPHGLGKKEEEEIPECECCGGDAGGPHYSVSCPYLLQLPRTVKSVGKGFVILCLHCGSTDNECRHERKRAHIPMCFRCGVVGDHSHGECWFKEKMELRRMKLAAGGA